MDIGSEKLTVLHTVQNLSSYLVFTFQPLHKLYPTVFKLVKEGTVIYMLPDRFRTGDIQREGGCLLRHEPKYLEGSI